MTGFGRASRRDRNFDTEVEARSVNHRFLSVKVSLPEPLARFEADVDRLVRDRVARGTVTISVSMHGASEGGPTLPPPARVKQVYRALDTLRRSLGLKTPVPFESVLSIPGLFAPANHAGAAAVRAWPSVRKLVAQAIGLLARAREREGRAIRRELAARLDAIDRLVARVRERAPSVLSAYQRKLDERIGTLIAQKGLEIAKQDLVKEIAVHSDRIDVSEELQRLGAHVAGFRRIIASGGSIGRRLDFLTQEMGREANTLASKAGDSEISGWAVEIKSELEKIKEQAENVE